MQMEKLLGWNTVVKYEAFREKGTGWPILSGAPAFGQDEIEIFSWSAFRAGIPRFSISPFQWLHGRVRQYHRLIGSVENRKSATNIVSIRSLSKRTKTGLRWKHIFPSWPTNWGKKPFFASLKGRHF
jgi:hypothetical protein